MKKDNKKDKQELVWIPKQVKHTFTPEERAKIQEDFHRAYQNLAVVQAEFDSVKATYKAKEAEAESRLQTLSATLTAGFDMRTVDVYVIFRPEDKEKDFYFRPTKTADGTQPADELVATEPMTPDDFQQELLAAEAGFENREEIELFPPADPDFGKIVVGRLAGKWFAAVRIQIGKFQLTERLDSEQKAYRARWDAIRLAGDRAQLWLKENLKDNAKGFEEPIQKALEAHKERVE